MSDCPCGLKQSLSDCCGQYIYGICPAPTAEALMRSRYTAYTLANSNYLQKTSDSVLFDATATREWSKQVTWTGLEVLNVTAGKPGDETGEVTYIARYRERGLDRTISEQALFKKFSGEWRYIGPKTAPAPNGPRKAGRNDPCPCGSGKKFKKCCGRS